MPYRCAIALLLSFFCSAGCSSTASPVASSASPGTAGADGDTPSGADDAGATPPTRVPQKDSGAASADAGAELCQILSVGAFPREPDVLIVLDRSESMKQEFNGGIVPVQTMRWEPAVSAVKEVTKALEESVRFGLMVFPNEANRCAKGELEVPVDLRTAQSIADELDMHQPGGATPLALTLTEAERELTGGPIDPDEKPRDKFVLLITDGTPNCSATLSSSNDLDDQDSYAAVDSLLAKHVRTYVVGFDTGGFAVLDELAKRGGTGDQQHRKVSDGAGLLKELESISRSLVSCTYELDMPPGDPRYVRVQIDGQSYPLGDAGWKLVNDSTIELQKPACERLQDGKKHGIHITVECEPVTVL